MDKWFCIGQSGPTVDGRVIPPEAIDEMAAGYDPKTYGARINCEHFRSVYPDGVFGSYGDVVALKSEKGPDGSRRLMAQINPTQELKKLSAARQKVFFSMEIAPDFAKTGKHYLMGLAVTDSPASLGTDMLVFSLKSDKAAPDFRAKLFSVAVETPVDFAEPAPGLLEKFKGLLAGKSAGDAARFAAIEEALLESAKEIAAVKADVAKHGAAAAAYDKLSADFAALKAHLEKTPKDGPRAPHAGGGSDTFAKTDC